MVNVNKGLPKCPRCGAVNWEEERYGLIYQQILAPSGRDRFEWGLAVPGDDTGADASIFCKSCLLRATPALEKAIRALID